MGLPGLPTIAGLALWLHGEFLVFPISDMQHVSRKKLKAEAGREDGARSFENEVLTQCNLEHK